MSEQDDVGVRGEGLAVAQLTDLCRRHRGKRMAYFRPVYMGEKNPTLDLFVQLQGVGSQLLFFSAQVKSTTDIPKRATSRLPVEVSKADVSRLLSSPIPAYILGVDVVNAKVYLVMVDENMRGGVSTIPRTHELNSQNMRLLWEEVRAYWKQVKKPKRHTTFPFQ